MTNSTTAPLRGAGAAMAIILQSTVADFDPAFKRQLPQLERAMLARGLDPDEFVFAKDFATPAATLPFVGPFFYDYTVFVGEQHFTVTEPNDARFLEYVSRRILAADDDDGDAPAREVKPPGLFGALLRWLAQPI